MQTRLMNDTPQIDFDSLYRAHGDRLWRSLLLHTGSPEVASDATAEAFAQAIRRGGALRDPAAWVWKAAFRIAAGEMKRQGMSVPLAEGDGPEELEPIIDLVRSLGRLTPHQRAAITLHYYAGYSHREIARIIGSTTAAVGVHVHRAKQRLRQELEDSDG